MRNDAYHFYSFDLTRSIAAMMVILLHWKELAMPGMAPPFADALGFFYAFGAFAVPLFFVLSGFIFTWLYVAPIHDRRIAPRDFFVLRLSRLYPLYLVTFAVAALTEPFAEYAGTILHNDLYDAFLSVFMLTGWGLEHGFSFNAPAWSVSTEMFLYGAFFLTARFVRINSGAAIAIILLGIALLPLSVHIAGGLAQFFAGILAYRAFQMWSVRRQRRWIAAATVAAIAAVAVYRWELRSHAGLDAVRSFVPHVPKLEVRYAILRDLLFPTLLFPLLIFVQAALEVLGTAMALVRHALVRWAGDLSYAIYLWHFPLMIIAVLLVKISGTSPLVFYSPLTMLAYMIVLLGVSHLSFYGFERPAMRAIRARFGAKRPARAGVSDAVPHREESDAVRGF